MKQLFRSSVLLLQGGGHSLVCRWLRSVCECMHAKVVDLLWHFSQCSRYFTLSIGSLEAASYLGRFWWCGIFALFLLDHAFVSTVVVAG